MLKASTLFYTLIFSIVLGLSVALLMSLFLYFNVANARVNKSKDLLFNISSTINIISFTSKQFPLNTVDELDLFGDLSDSVKVLRRIHGLLNVYKITAKNHHQFEEFSAIFGWEIPSNPTSIYLADNTFPLSLCGDTKIEGNAFVPSTPVKRAYIEGQNYLGSSLIYGNTTSSERNVPILAPNYYKEVLSQIEFNSDLDSLVTLESFSKKKNSFLAKRWFLKSNKLLEIDNQDFTGNLIVISSKRILIKNNSNFVNVVFVAPVIYIEENTLGEFQCIATDSLIVGESVRLNYPSNLCLLKTEEEGIGYLEIGKNSNLEGSIVILEKQVSNFGGDKPMINIKQGVVVLGLVYSPYKIRVSSNISISGSFYCQETELKTSSAVYSNHLLDFKITPSKQSDYFVGTSSFPNSKNRHLIKWVN